ncbi:3-dehydroquinate synthase [Carboxylicivirga linearis]|uniref:3-dehydroquinate synthase n=1 Tax=Carboxylicivirga linearis TaxID=1628157 RepID=A0ABS5JSH4_9BACT|nr:3-dehydroquinate synthase [Carboxylicivirga linearis]MBS2097874.1 3-dehydroquinate synthase [Carboxylicivirga linearis]
MFPLISKESNVFIVDDLTTDIEHLIKNFPEGKVFLLSDTESYKHCFHKIEKVIGLCPERTIVIPDGDNNKGLEAAEKVWKLLSDGGADRKSLLVTLGGGMPCDLGGFAASTFKRGIQFINIPTTLLSQVDASIGGKTGINFAGLKNEVGVFNQATAVLIDTSFLETLDQPNIISGFAEMIKHAFIYSADKWEELKAFDIFNPDLDKLKELVADSIRIKDHFVQSDPTENHIRKALNFGHTYGHAFESMAMYEGRPILHGYAVAFGMICELYLSHTRLGFPMPKVLDLAEQLEAIYGHFDFSKDKYDELYRLMTHDKKNEDNKINFTLLEEIGKIQINCQATQKEVYDALYFYNNYKQH